MQGQKDQHTNTACFSAREPQRREVIKLRPCASSARAEPESMIKACSPRVTGICKMLQASLWLQICKLNGSWCLPMLPKVADRLEDQGPQKSPSEFQILWVVACCLEQHEKNKFKAKPKLRPKIWISQKISGLTRTR